MDDNKPKPSKWEQTSTRRFLRWLFSARTIRRGLVTLAWAVALIALCYGIDDWASRNAWNNFRQSYESRVASLDLRTYTPKEIPDSENFAATPFVQSWFNMKDTNFLYDHDAFVQADNMMAGTAKLPSGGHYRAKFEDLVAWQQALAAGSDKSKEPKDGFRSDTLDLASRAQAAPAVLNALRDDDDAIAELREASAKPQARYQVVYNMDDPWGILLPHLAKMKGTCRRLELRACAELALGRNDDAFNDEKLMFYLIDSLKSEPFLISYLVRIASANIAFRPIAEGIAEHRWTDAQLQQLQAMAESYNWIAELQPSLHAEGAAGILTTELMKKKGLGLLASLANDMGPNTHSFWNDEHVLNFIGSIIPSGWYDQEKTRYGELFEDQFRGSMNESSRRVFPSVIAANMAKLAMVATDHGNDFITGTPTHGTLHAITHHELIASMMLPSLSRVPMKAAKSQVATDELALACALERYRLANGQLPDTLETLVPRFITHVPNDVITGEPLKYRRSDDSGFKIYSVGWNGTDDGGVAGPTSFDEKEGDWVWQYPSEN